MENKAPNGCIVMVVIMFIIFILLFTAFQTKTYKAEESNQYLLKPLKK